ncbi:CG30 [Lonomia obliqua multiple nucleopolyhedrovirus]|uniref:CG30 n=1 Tax=Lonomia obliqua multiple nucleopolyhedrovirus TaxID=134394 RepID=A0A126FC71_9ABAC|nr:CG30 [Lonomia obliqua multiple nucleopolyhedrovirus]AKN80973.1 CG30 [Lonomia obliqua multiple nucleopolyhedrovirus]
MDSVKLQCNICLSVAEIKQIDLFDELDRIIIIPVVELYICKHHLCITCIRKIRNKKKLLCPMCRAENQYFNMYSVNNNKIDYVKCNINNVFCYNESVDKIDVASLAKILFHNSLLHEEPDENEDKDKDKYNKCANNLMVAEMYLKNIKNEISEQTKFNIKQKLALKKLEYDCVNKTQTINSLHNKINKCKNEYNDLNRKINELKIKRLIAEKEINSINKMHIKILNKNKLLTEQYKMLSKKNIDLIKHKNILQKEYMLLTQKTCNFISLNSSITAQSSINLTDDTI